MRGVAPLIQSMACSVKRNPQRAMGIIAVTFLTIVALFSDKIAPYDHRDRDESFLRPSAEHILGTNNMGQDLFSEIVRGTTTSLEVGLISATVAVGIGVTVGILAGYYRGIWEQILMATTDVFIIIPSMSLIIVMVAYTEPSVYVIILAISALAWCSMARIIHPRVMALREAPFVQSSKALGKSDAFIIIHHIIPNCKHVIWAKLAMAVGAGMLAEASLSFIGLGDPFNVSWGSIINQALNQGALITGYWWWYVVPGLLICISVVSFLLISHEVDETGLKLE